MLFNISKNIMYIVTFYMVIDFVVFIAWIATDQIPSGEFYLGALTAGILKIIL